MSKANDEIIKRRSDKLCDKFVIYLKKLEEIKKLEAELRVDLSEFEFFVNRANEDNQEDYGR